MPHGVTKSRTWLSDWTDDVEGDKRPVLQKLEDADEINQKRHKQMERYTMIVDWKNQYCQNDYATQANQQSQCKLPMVLPMVITYQITNGIFHRNRTKKSQNLYGDTKDHKYSKQSWERKTKPEEPGILTSDYNTKLQSLKQCGTGTKIEV